MAEIFGVDENDWCDALKDILRRLEKKRKESDKPPGEFLKVEHTYELLGIDAWLFGEPQEMINLKIARR